MPSLYKASASSSRSSKKSITRSQRIAAWKADRNTDQVVQSEIPKWGHLVGLSSTALHVLGFVHAVARRHGAASFRNATLAQRLNCSESTITKMLTECQRKGAILPLYLVKADGSYTRRLLTCCPASAQFLANLTEADWRNLAFAPLAGANRAGVLEGAQNFAERCETHAVCFPGRLHLALHMEGGSDETIVDLLKKSRDREASFQASNRGGPLGESSDNCIHSDFQSELNKEANAAGGVASPASSSQAQPIPPCPVASPGPTAIPDPTPHVAPAPLPVEAKKRGGGKFEAEHPGVMARIRALCGGDTDASWNASYTRAVQVFAKTWNAPAGPGDQELQLLERHLPESRQQTLRLAELVYPEVNGENQRVYWSSLLYTAAYQIVDAWDILQGRMLIFRTGALKDGHQMQVLRMGNNLADVERLEACTSHAELLDRCDASEINYVRACLYLSKFGQRSRLTQLHARHAGYLEDLCLHDWNALLVILSNFEAGEIEAMLGVSAERLLALVRCHYIPMRAAAVAFEETAWIRNDPRTSKLVSEGDFVTSIAHADDLMSQVKPREADVLSAEEMLLVENYLKFLNLPPNA